jgi:hypothetical protein
MTSCGSSQPDGLNPEQHQRLIIRQFLADPVAWSAKNGRRASAGKPP